MTQSMVQKCVARAIKTTGGVLTPESGAKVINYVARQLNDPNVAPHQKLKTIGEMNALIADSLSDYELRRTNAIANKAKTTELYTVTVQAADELKMRIEDQRGQDPSILAKNVNEFIETWSKTIKSVAADNLDMNLDNLVMQDKTGTFGAILRDNELLAPEIIRIADQALDTPFAKGLWEQVWKPLIGHANNLGNILRERPQALLNARWFSPAKIRNLDREYFIGRIIEESHGDLPKAVRDMGGEIQEDEETIDAFRRVVGSYYDRIADGENIYHNGTKVEMLTEGMDLDKAMETEAATLSAALDNATQRRISQRPEALYHLPYKDGAAFMRLFQEFGDGDVHGTLFREMNSLNRFNATYEVFGADPELVFAAAWNRFTEGASKAEMDVLHRAWTGVGPNALSRTALIPSARSVFDHVIGTADIPENVEWAERAAVTQKIFTALALQSSSIAQLSDIPTRFTVITQMGGPTIETALDSNFGWLMQLAPGDDQRRFLNAALAGMNGFNAETMEKLGSTSSRLLDTGAPSSVNKASDALLGLSGVRSIDNAAKRKAATQLTSLLGSFADQSWAELAARGDDLLDFWQAQGMTETLWEGVRKHAREAPAFDVEGKFLLVGDIEDRALRIEYRKFLATVIDNAVPTPNAIQRATVTWGSRPGTMGGTFARMLGQFMAFPLTIQQRVMPLIQENGGTGAMASYGVLALMYGTLGLWIKDTLANKTPTPLNRPKAWLAVMRQSGFMPIYANLVNTALSTSSAYEGVLRDYEGPTLRGIDRIIGTGASWLSYGVDAADHAITGEPFNRSAPILPTAKTVREYLPGANLPLVKGAVDNLFTYALYEALDPGWTQRYQRKLEDQGQSQLFPIQPQQ